MKPTKFGMGQPVRRVEDTRFISGAGMYTADVMKEGALAACFLRAPHVHAVFTVGDLADVRGMAGVRHVGDAVAMVVADTEERAREAPTIRRRPDVCGFR